MIKDSNKRITITLSKELHHELHMISYETGMSISALITMVMEEFTAEYRQHEKECETGGSDCTDNRG